MSRVTSLCLNRASCAIPATNAGFGDPCSGRGKRLAVQVTCSYKGAGAFAPFLAPDGGDTVLIKGANFGPSIDLVQNVSYGPVSGLEYSTSSLVYVDHETLRAVVSAGVGNSLIFIVTVADQASLPTRTSLSYAQPYIISISPTHGPTLPTAGFNSITVTGTNFGLLNPRVSCVVAFGNYNDTTLANFWTMPITQRSPSLALVQDPTYRPPFPLIYTISFSVPPTLGGGVNSGGALGLNRTIRIIPYLLAAGEPTPDVVQAIAPQTLEPWRAEYSFDDPIIDFITATAASVASCNALNSARRFTAALAAFPAIGRFNCSNVRYLQIFGRNFGASALATGDSISRVIEL